MKIVHLVRHGAHDEVGHILSGRSEIGLNGEGRTQATDLARVLSTEPLCAIHCSPRQRALETAQPLAEGAALAIQRDPALDEIDFGVFSGRSFAELSDDPRWRSWNEERATARCPHGETMSEAVARAAGFIFSLPDGHHACVTHCDIIRGVIVRVLGMPFDRLFMLDCDPGSITTLAINGQRVRLTSLNRLCGR